MSTKLAEVFARVLRIPVERLGDETSPENTAEWDSLAAMELVSQLEETFGVELTTLEIMRMRSIGVAREVLRQRGVADV